MTLKFSLNPNLLRCVDVTPSEMVDAVCDIFNTASARRAGEKRYDIETPVGKQSQVMFGDYASQLKLGATPIAESISGVNRYKLYIVAQSLYDGCTYEDTPHGGRTYDLGMFMDVNATDGSAVPEEFAVKACAAANYLLESVLSELQRHIVNTGFAFDDYNHFVFKKFIRGVDLDGNSRVASLPMLVLMFKIFNVMPELDKSYLWDDVKKFLHDEDGKFTIEASLKNRITRDNQSPKDISYLVNEFIHKGLVNHTEVDIFLRHAITDLHEFCSMHTLHKSVLKRGEGEVIRLAKTVANLIVVTSLNGLTASIGKMLQEMENLPSVIYAAMGSYVHASDTPLTEGAARLEGLAGSLMAATTSSGLTTSVEKMLREMRDLSSDLCTALKSNSTRDVPLSERDITLEATKPIILSYIKDTKQCNTKAVTVYSPRGHSYVTGYVDLNGIRVVLSKDADPFGLVTAAFSDIQNCNGHDLSSLEIDGTPSSMTSSDFQGVIYYKDIPVIAIFKTEFSGFEVPGLLFKPLCSEVGAAVLVLMRDGYFNSGLDFRGSHANYMKTSIYGWMRWGSLPKDSFCVTRLSNTEDGDKADLLKMIVMMADAVPSEYGTLQLQMQLSCMVFPHKLEERGEAGAEGGLDSHEIVACPINEKNFASENRNLVVTLLHSIFGGRIEGAIDYAQLTELKCVAMHMGSYATVVESAVSTMLHFTTNAHIEECGRILTQALLSHHFDLVAELINLFELKRAHTYAKQVSDQVIELWSEHSKNNRTDENGVNYLSLLNISDVMLRLLTAETVPTPLWDEVELMPNTPLYHIPANIRHHSNPSQCYTNYLRITRGSGVDNNYIVCINGYPYHVRARYIAIALMEAGIISGLMGGRGSSELKPFVEARRLIFKAQTLVVTEITRDYECKTPIVFK